MSDQPTALKVLLADDDRVIHRMLSSHFAHAQMELVSVYNGSDVLPQALADPPDVLVLDVMLPGMDGFKVLDKWVKQESLRDIPVIILTVWNEDEDKSNAIHDGATAYMTKPFRPTKLVQMVHELVKGSA